MDANNKVFLLKKVCSTLMDGTYTDIIAIFSTHEKATEVIMYQHDIRRYEKLNDNCYRYIFDGTMTEFYEIDEITIDEVPDVFKEYKE